MISPRNERDDGRRIPWLGLLAFVLAGLGLPPAPATGLADAHPGACDAAVDCAAAGPLMAAQAGSSVDGEAARFARAATAGEPCDRAR